MNTRNFLFVLFAMFALVVNAQSGYSDYLSKAMEKIESGDCESAKKFYAAYKELSGKSVSSVEVLLLDCKKEYYNIGETMVVGDKRYTVAYVRDGGKHGFAVYREGWDAISKEYTRNIGHKEVPTLEELKLIYANREKVGLYDTYWSCSLSPTGANSPLCNMRYYYVMDFSTGKIFDLHWDNKNGVVMLVHRF